MLAEIAEKRRIDPGQLWGILKPVAASVEKNLRGRNTVVLDPSLAA